MGYVNTVLWACFIYSIFIGVVAKMPEKHTITIDEVRTLKDNTTVLFIDVREPQELKDTGIIPGSINIPLNTVEEALTTTTKEEFKQKYNREKPNLDSPIVLTCRSGRRSAIAQETAWKHGYQNVRNYQGGWLEWAEHLSKE